MDKDQNRPNPDVLLARLKEEEAQKARGKLKIFLGYAAGVGKTYAMLEAAHSRKAEGLDVVIAVIETHGRPETEVLAKGLDVVLRAQIQYRGVNLTEMDLDAVLARKPQIALVDELAHTNAPGTRHPKRWQDIEELLNAGIDVWTTLNIQHLESFRDIVAQITGVIQRETIPDRVLDLAAEIEVVDLPPEELLQRLREGKVYVPEQAARAMEHFFESGNLIALREITLRRAADRVDEQMREYLETYPTAGLWPTAERLLVCISGSPHSERLIRTARRLAEELKTEWHALYVETPGDDRLTQENRERIWRDLRLAESLGAKEVTTVTAESAADAVIDYARKHKITKVIVGRPTRPTLRQKLRGSFVDRVLRKSKEIDVYVVSEGPGPERKSVSPASLSGRLAKLLHQFAARRRGDGHRSECRRIPFACQHDHVLPSGGSHGRSPLRIQSPALFTAILGVLAFDFFLVPPLLTFAVGDTQYLITFAALFIVGAVISTLVARARRHTETLKTREAQTTTLYSLSKDLASAVSLQDILKVIIHHVGDTLNARLAILLPEGESLKMEAASPGFSIGEKEKSVAIWAFRNGQMAGWGTETLSSAELWYVPLQTAGRVVGVMAIQLSSQDGRRARP